MTCLNVKTFLLIQCAGGVWTGRGFFFRTFGTPNLKGNVVMRIEDIKKIERDKCEKFSDFAQSRMPMPGTKKRIGQIIDKEIMIVDFRVTDSKHRQNSKCLQIQFVLDDEICVAFTGSVVLLDQIQFSKDKSPFKTKINRNDNYFTLA